jgi:hypothetical protein
MTVRGVNVICAATFLATIGDVGRFESPRKLTGYLGLDPKVRQSGTGAATHGRISKAGIGRARHALVEASWSTVRHPGPIRAFYQRIRARRGHQVAVVAAARKLACLHWCLLTREEDYAYAQPSLTRKKLHRLELSAGAGSQRGKKSGLWAANAAMRGQRGRKLPQVLRLSSSSTGARAKLSQIGGVASRLDLIFMRRPKRKPAKVTRHSLPEPEGQYWRQCPQRMSKSSTGSMEPGTRAISGWDSSIPASNCTKPPQCSTRPESFVGTMGYRKPLKSSSAASAI